MDEELRRRLAALTEFLAARPPADNDEEFADDLADFVSKLRASARGGGPRAENGAESEWLEIRLPPDLERRQRNWIEAALRRTNWIAASARRRLGCDDVPFPGDVLLADALVKWAERELELEPRWLTGVSDWRVPEPVERALRSLRLQPTVYRSDWSDEQIQKMALVSALKGIMDDAQRLVELIGCEQREAVRWLLAGKVPEHACVIASAISRGGRPNTVTLTLNPNVVKADEVRSLYRQLRKVASPTGDELCACIP